MLSTGFVILAALAVAVVSVRGSSCTPPPPGLVSWWPAEGSALDSAGGNNGTLMNGTGFTNGEVGTAFNLNGANNFVLVNPASTNLDVGQGDGFTIEGWVNPTTLANDLPFVEYEKSLGTFNGSDVGVHFYVSVQSSPGSLYANIVETNGVVGHQITSPAGLVTTGVWQHIALSYSKAIGMGTIYLNGAVVVQQNLGGFTSQTSFTNILIGARTTFGSIASPSIKFAGKLDEVSVYNRALSTNEIQAICNAGSLGKCTSTPPAVPVISNFTPASGTNGTVVTITGTNFSATAASNIVYFGAVRAIVSSASPTNLLVTIPAGSTFAPITVTVNGLVAYSVAAFEPTFAGSGAAIDASTFAPGVNLSVSSPYAVVIADLDGDGKPDLVVANVFANSFSIYQNIGSNGVLNAASFAAPVVFPVGSGSDDPTGVTAADVDGDGKLDLLVADRNNNQIAIYRNSSSGGMLTTNSFAPPVFLTVAAQTS